MNPEVENVDNSTATGSSLFLNWTEPVDKGGNATTVIAYRVEWTPEDNGGFTNVTETCVEITNLASNTLYNIKVAAIGNNNVVGEFSSFQRQATGDYFGLQYSYDKNFRSAKKIISFKKIWIGFLT